ncbi:hypothetical protein LJC33_07580 [Eubacteriales bacterium OttesenSCG-928-N13]|nr:hypothetical protein [Eubacteriales bacterium OttesenSCG-928-N13]
MNEEIARLEAELQLKYRELGKTVCDQTDEINRLVDRLIEAKLKQREREGGTADERGKQT